MWEIQFALNSKAAVLLCSTACISLPSFPIWHCFLSSKAAIAVATAPSAITSSLPLQYCTTFNANRNIRFIMLFPLYK